MFRFVTINVPVRDNDVPVREPRIAIFSPNLPVHVQFFGRVDFGSSRSSDHLSGKLFFSSDKTKKKTTSQSRTLALLTAQLAFRWHSTAVLMALLFVVFPVFVDGQRTAAVVLHPRQQEVFYRTLYARRKKLKNTSLLFDLIARKTADDGKHDVDRARMTKRPRFVQVGLRKTAVIYTS